MVSAFIWHQKQHCGTIITGVSIAPIALVIQLLRALVHQEGGQRGDYLRNFVCSMARRLQRVLGRNGCTEYLKYMHMIFCRSIIILKLCRLVHINDRPAKISPIGRVVLSNPLPLGGFPRLRQPNPLRPEPVESPSPPMFCALISWLSRPHYYYYYFKLDFFMIFLFKLNY